MTGLMRRAADTDARQKSKDEKSTHSQRVGFGQKNSEQILEDALSEFSRKMSGPVRLKNTRHA